MKLTGGEIIAEYLIAAGMPYVIGIPGHGCLGLADAFISRKKRIKVLPVKQEMSGVHLADGYYRACKRPLMVFTSIGPGAINTAIGAATAYVDSIPVLVINGSAHTYMRGRGLLQELERSRDDDFERVLQPVVKRSWRVDAVGQLPSIMKRAFTVMMTGRRGPVNIVLPMNVQSDSFETDTPKIPSFASACGKGDPSAINRALDLLANAKRPVILVGGGAAGIKSTAALQELAELKGAAVVTTMAGKGIFPEDHSLYAWHTGSKGTAVGLKMNSNRRTSSWPSVAGLQTKPPAPTDRERLFPFRRPSLSMLILTRMRLGKTIRRKSGSPEMPGTVLVELAQGLREVSRKKLIHSLSFINEIARESAKWQKYVDRLCSVKTRHPTISQVLRELRKNIAHDAFLVTSSGNSQAQMLQEFPFYVPGTCITTGGFSTMGFSLPAAIGVKLAHPERQVVAMVGDGDFLMTMQEMATAMELGTAIVMVVVNNQGWLAIKDLQMDAYGKDRTIDVDFTTPDGKPYSPEIAEVAKAFGWHSQKVDHLKAVGSAIRKALAAGQPALVEVVVHRDYPYSGSPALGWWDVPIPAYLKARRAKYEKERKQLKF